MFLTHHFAASSSEGSRTLVEVGHIITGALNTCTPSCSLTRWSRLTRRLKQNKQRIINFKKGVMNFKP